VVVLGRGGAGKSTLARRLGELTGIPVVELDRVFWQEGLVARTAAEWTAIQQELVAAPRWIMEGDLGPYDVLDVRLRAADTVIVLDFSLARCAWRALRRSRERLDFWRWVVGYRRVSLPPLRAAIARSAPGATVHVLRDPRAVARFLGATCF
jgi:adenylate kinase family enzyme